MAIHALLDGRDTLPRSADGFMRELIAYANGRAQVASVSGRYFGMDRDARWDRTEKWYRAAVEGVGPTGGDPVAVIRQAYERGESDEFVTPTVIVEHGQPVAPMRDGDAVICFNYRSDRMLIVPRAPHRRRVQWIRDLQTSRGVPRDDDTIRSDVHGTNGICPAITWGSWRKLYRRWV